MEAFDRIGTVCLVLSCVLGAYVFVALRGTFLLATMFSIVVIPILWMAGLNILDFLTRPFSEKGLKGVLSWVIVIVISLILYAIFFVLLSEMLVLLHVD